MTAIKRIAGALLALCLLLALAPAAAAEAEPPRDERFDGKSWDQVVEDFLTARAIKADDVALGYANTVTGEEHYLNGAVYMVSGSMYKVTLNMVYTERIHNGEMSWTDTVSGYRYEKALEESIVYSNNDLSVRMSYALGDGSWKKFRQVLAPYMSPEPDKLEDKFFENNFSTAEQVIYCLRLLQSNPERFPRVEEMMRRAEPTNYFLYHEQPVEIAHKYGYLADGTRLYMNDCAICYTDDPICIVAFTDTITKPYDFLADYCTLMCDYAQYQTALRRVEEQRQAEEAAIRALEQGSTAAVKPELTAAPDPEREQTDSALRAAVTSAAQQTGKAVSGQVSLLLSLVLGLLVLGIGIFSLAAVADAARRRRLKPFWGVLCVLFVTAALLAAVISPRIGSLSVKTEGDPREAVTGFFDAVIDQDYDRAYGWLGDYVSLGLENEPASEQAQQVYAALRESYSYKLYGDCEQDKAEATQQVLLSHLDLPAMLADLKDEANAALERMAAELKKSEMYDENDEYLPGITEQAYAEAVQALLARSEEYRTTTGLELKLSYTDEGWKLMADADLIAALGGGKGGERG